MKKLTFLTLFTLFTCFVFAQSFMDKMEKEIDAIFEEWNSTETPGGVVGIVQDGEIIFSKAYGMASLEYDVVNTTETIFNIASVSKQFTAFTMVLLEQQGKLSIDDDVRKYIPELPDFGTTITIRHLLTHTSGLRNFQSMLSLAGWRSGDNMTNEDLLRYISRQKDLNFPVGSEYLYCNTGFNLTTAIVERVTGQSYQDWTKENIFDPLGMDDTNYREDLTKIYKKTATSYSVSDGNFIQPLKYWTYMGNGNVYTTVEDLAKWMGNFADGTVGGAAATNRLLERGILTSGDTITYALGIRNTSYRGIKLYTHGGSVGGYRSNFLYYPEQKAGVVVIANFSRANPGPKSVAVADLYLEDHFTESKPERSSGGGRNPLRKPIEMSTQSLQIYTGKYYSPEVDAYYEFVIEEDKLVAKHNRHNDFTLTPYSKDDLRASASFFREVKAKWEGSKVTGIHVSNGRVRNLWFEKVE
ncbi:MAG: serine hydrolase domain-containing protein [Bacteroidota bacterium]